MKKFLHVGCGSQNKSVLKGFNSIDWEEIRFDIDLKVNPDIVGTITDMSLVKTSSIDAIFSSHNIEHIYAHEVPIALFEFKRVLKNDGFVVMTCPDLQSVCEAVAKDQLLEPVYLTKVGEPITPLDILYGHRGHIANGNEYMSHKCGFTYSALAGVFYQVDFKSVYGGPRAAPYFDLWLIACKQEKTDEELKYLGQLFLA